MNILIIENTVETAMTYRLYLEPLASEIAITATGKAGLAAVWKRPPDVIVANLNLPDMSGIELLQKVKAANLPVETIFVTDHGSIDLAVKAMREGAFDFIVKPMPAERLRRTVRHAAERASASKPAGVIRELFPADHFADFIGQSLPMQAVYRTLRNAAQSNATVFVTGESGTGKELCATALHKLSPRVNKPFVAINCAAIPRDLLESEIFGHVKGAFTGATQDRNGVALMANGGTLFLDEIGEMELGFQAKLLRFLETGLVQRVGESEPRPTDVRIVCATNRDPLLAVRSGHLRQDLYYRLHVIPVQLPALRERRGDIMSLARHFLQTFAREEGKVFNGFSADAENAMLSYHWPGNIRELKNLIRQIAVLTPGGRIDLSHLPFTMGRDDAPDAASEPDTSHCDREVRAASFIAPLEQQIEQAIDAALTAYGGSVPKAAAALKVSPSTIYRRLQARTETLGSKSA